MDAGKTFIGDIDASEPVDFYVLSFWPAAPLLDRILRQSSRIARYWHEAGFIRAPG